MRFRYSWDGLGQNLVLPYCVHPPESGGYAGAKWVRRVYILPSGGGWWGCFDILFFDGINLLKWGKANGWPTWQTSWLTGRVNFSPVVLTPGAEQYPWWTRTGRRRTAEKKGFCEAEHNHFYLTNVPPERLKESGFPACRDAALTEGVFNRSISQSEAEWYATFPSSFN
jgi:hypothetical protein